MKPIAYSGYLRVLIAILIIFVCCVSCRDQVRKRPMGWMRLGPVMEFLGEETFLATERLMIRRDEVGFSAMSTMCTYDLSALRRVNAGDSYFWTSTLTESRYSAEGDVLSGPATAPLPYFFLRLDAKVHGGPVDTLYVHIGNLVGRDWRLPFGGQEAKEN